MVGCSSCGDCVCVTVYLCLTFFCVFDQEFDLRAYRNNLPTLFLLLKERLFPTLMSLSKAAPFPQKPLLSVQNTHTSFLTLCMWLVNRSLATIKVVIPQVVELVLVLVLVL